MNNDIPEEESTSLLSDLSLSNLTRNDDSLFADLLEARIYKQYGGVPIGRLTGRWEGITCNYSKAYCWA